jgi:hypothetical protein
MKLLASCLSIPSDVNISIRAVLEFPFTDSKSIFSMYSFVTIELIWWLGLSFSS